MVWTFLRGTFVAMLVVFAGMVIWAIVRDDGVPSSSSRNVSPRPVITPVAPERRLPPISINATQLYDRFQANEARANRDFKGRTLGVYPSWPREQRTLAVTGVAGARSDRVD